MEVCGASRLWSIGASSVKGDAKAARAADVLLHVRKEGCRDCGSCAAETSRCAGEPR
jgi:hypothetical protein